MKAKAILSWGMLLATPLALAACGQSKQAEPAPDPDAKPGISVSGGTLVLPAVKGRPGAAYFAVTNGNDGPTSLAAVHVDGFAKAEMHETRDGKMEPLNWVQLEPGQTVKFERGGRHVMLFDGDGKAAAGGTVEMTLTFSGGDKVSAPLKVEAAGGGEMAKDDMAGMKH